MCPDCGTVVGSPLTPIYEEKGITINFEPGVPTPYHTICQLAPDLQTTWTAILTDCSPLNEDSLAQWSSILGTPLETRDGYEWLAVKIDISFSEPNAWKYGPLPLLLFEDYYTPYLRDDTQTELGNRFTRMDILWHGETAEELVIWTDNWEKNQSDKTYLYTMHSAFRVPKGYSGVVIGLMSSANELKKGEYFVDNPPSEAIVYRII